MLIDVVMKYTKWLPIATWSANESESNIFSASNFSGTSNRFGTMSSPKFLIKNFDKPSVVFVPLYCRRSSPARYKYTTKPTCEKSAHENVFSFDFIGKLISSRFYLWRISIRKVLFLHRNLRAPISNRLEYLSSQLVSRISIRNVGSIRSCWKTKLEKVWKKE